MTYRMIAIDLDGTLFNREGRVSHANAAAVRRAVDAGVTVVPCTGRAWCECAAVRDAFPPEEPDLDFGVFVTGAVVTELATSVVVNTATFDPSLALKIVEHLWEAPEAVLVFRDATQAHHDYLVTGAGELSRNTHWWFKQSGAAVVHKERVTEADLTHVLRIGVVADNPRMSDLAAKARAVFSRHATLQHFEAVPGPDIEPGVHVLEIFAAGVDKWRGLSWLAERDGIPAHQIAAIGDQINDTSMLAHAGCGIAMANAIDAVRDVADHVTLDCDADGVAHAIDQLLSDLWHGNARSISAKGDAT